MVHDAEEVGPATWTRLDTLLKQTLILCFILLISYAVFIIGGADESHIEEWFGGRRNFFLIYAIVLPLCTFYNGALYKRRVNKWVKLFEIENNEMIELIIRILRENNLPFKRRSEQGKLPGFPISFAEIFNIDGGRISIGVQRMKGPCSVVDIGPISHAGKEIENLGIDVLREKIDITCAEFYTTTNN